MTAPKTERRKYDEEILVKLAEIHTRQQTVLDRLAKINGTVDDYNENKYKMGSNENDIITICDRLIKHEDLHKTLDERYIGRRLFTTLSVILGVLIVAFNLLQYFKLG